MGQDYEELQTYRKCIKELPGGQGKVEGYVINDTSRQEVEELLDMIVQSYRVGSGKGGNEEEKPDFMWIISDDEESVDKIYQSLLKKANFTIQVKKEGATELFVSGIQEKEKRDSLVRILKGMTDNFDGKILVGNGFRTIESKEKNRELQRYIFEIIRRKHERKQVCLIEEYYHDLAVSYIGSKIERENLYVDELEYVEREDKEKGKDLYETLYWYLKMKRNAAQTAAKLRIHRNTLMSRIIQLNEMIGIDDKDGADCERLLMVMEMKKVK